MTLEMKRRIRLMSRNFNKAAGPTNIPNRILKQTNGLHPNYYYGIYNRGKKVA